MSRFYFVVIDTTDSTSVRSLPRGIVNSYVIKAQSEDAARGIVLRTMPQNIAIQVASSIFVYDLDTLMYHIDNAEKTGTILPLFSFMPLNGGRPSRILNLEPRPQKVETAQKQILKKPIEQIQPSTTIQQPTIQQIETQEDVKEVLNESEIEVVELKKPKKQTKKIVKTPINPSDSRQVRSTMFQQPDYTPQGEQTNELSPSAEELIRRMGITPLEDGADEGVNQRINNSVGRNLNQTVQRRASGPSDTLSQEQLELLRKAGAVPQQVEVQQTQLFDEEGNPIESLVDSSLAELPQSERAISAEDIRRLQEEFAREQEATGIVVDDSKPIIR